MASSNVNYKACDESKCVARGRNDFEPGQQFLYDRFDDEDVTTCYGDANGDFFPKMCADGFVPVTIDSEPTVSVTGATKNCINNLWRAYILHEFKDLPLEYFTCCPPKSNEIPLNSTQDTETGDEEEFTTPNATLVLSNGNTTGNTSGNTTNTSITDTDPSRHCSDPVFAPKGWKEEDDDADQVVASLCAEMGQRKYPRRTKKFWFTASFVCCDTLEPIAITSTSNEEGEAGEAATTIDLNFMEPFTEASTISWVETQTSHLDDVDCIPYSNRFYDRGFLDRNRVGRTWINKRLCDFPGGDSRFKYPRLLDGVLEDVPGPDMTRRYQCCKTPSVPVLEPYVQDSKFYIECYTWLALFVVAAVASAIIVIALSLPAIFQRTTSNRKGNIPHHNHHNDKPPSTCKPPTQRQIPYSPYNLYLVYLAIPDLVVSLTFVFGVCARMINQQPVDHNLIGTIVLVYGLANCVLNAMVCHQVFLLLQKSNQRQRVKPPTLTRVTLEAISVYVVSVLMFSWVYFPMIASQRAYNDGDYEKARMLEKFSQVTGSITGVMIILPIVYVVWASFSIWRHKYIPPKSNRMSVTNKANRALAVYFFRIVAVFLIVWIIGLFIGGLATAVTIMDGNNWPMYVFFTLVAIQQIATTGVILMSPVSRQYIKALFSLSYCFPNWKDRQAHRQQHQDHRGEQSRRHAADPTLITCSATESPPSAAEVEAAGGDTAAYTVPMETNEKKTSPRHSVDIWISREMQLSDDSFDSFLLRDVPVDCSESSDDIRASISVLQQFSSSREILDLFSNSSIRRDSKNGVMMHGSIPEQSDRTQPITNKGRNDKGAAVGSEE